MLAEKVTNVALTAVTYFPSHARVDIASVFSSMNTKDLPVFCRVEIKITTKMTADSFAITEVWLSDGWNDHGSLVVGDGGLAEEVRGPVVDRHTTCVDVAFTVSV